jgi:hypothetical protein
LITILKKDYEDTVEEFKKLVHATLQSMNGKKVEVLEFKTFLTIELDKEVAKIQKRSTIDEIFKVLHLGEYWTFFEYELLKAVIERYCEKELEHRLDEYLRKFGSYCERKISEVPMRRYRSPKSGDTHILYVKLKKDFDGITLQEVKDIESRLQKKFHTGLYKLQCYRGCVLLVFESLHKLECFQYSKEQITEDLKFVVLQLYSNDYTYYESETASASSENLHKFYLEQLSTVSSNSDPGSSHKMVSFACGCAYIIYLIT